MPAPLPIDAVLPELREAVRVGNVVLHAPTGAGKTTRVPPALLDVVRGEILVLEPRRVAARAAAARMAEERGEAVGATIGFQVRLERRVSAATRVRVVTEGIAVRRLVGDPLLEGVGAVVLDEIHERSLDVDLALALCRQVQREVRPDLRIVAMSATLDTDRLAAWLDARVIRSEGRAFPVAMHHLPRPDDRPVELQVADGVRRALAEAEGDVLAFLPGVAEIHATSGALGRPDGVDVLPLHGRLRPAEQDAALRPGTRRRVVLATNVAETSVTIPGVTAVVDSGLVRRLRHDAGSGLDRLVTEATSQASADQRAGRAGRTAPGTCWRLWTAVSHGRRPAHDPPEIARVDLAGAMLALLAFGERDPGAWPWFDPPPAHAVEAALDLLARLGALDARGLTDLGRTLAGLPAHPRVARALVEAWRLGDLAQAARACALLAEPPALRRDRAVRRTDDDLADQVDALAQPGRHGWQAVSPGAVTQVRQVADQLARLAEDALGPARGGTAPLARAMLAGWPDRVARRRGGEAYTLATGRGATLHAACGVREEPWLLALDVVDTGRTEARILLASRVDPAWLEVPSRIEVTYDPVRDRVVGAERARWGALVLREHEGVRVPPERVQAALVEALGADPSRGVPDEGGFPRLVARLRCAARAAPAEAWPATDDAALQALAAELAPGCRSLAELRRRDWVGTLLGRMPWALRTRLDTLAPETLAVPSGSEIRLAYADDGRCTLSVRIQELFGWTRTPEVGGSPVVLELLAPNGRPQQVTEDLEGFWDRQWPAVRAELRGRYPRHPWPEDPRTAKAWRPGMKRER